MDAAYAGVAAMLPSHSHILNGAERADSLVVNPHKWLFAPVDISVLYCRRMDVLRAAFALTPEHILRTSENAAVKNLMDTGIQLGRRFRSLKLWMILRSFGARTIRDTLSAHIQLAQRFAAWVDAHPDFERLAPVPFSVVCFRWNPAGRGMSPEALDSANERLVNLVNENGDVFLSHTKLREGFALRLAIGHLQTTERHVRRAWDLLVESSARLLGLSEPPLFYPRLTIVFRHERHDAVFWKGAAARNQLREQAGQMRIVAGDEHVTGLGAETVAHPAGRILGLKIARR